MKTTLKTITIGYIKLNKQELKTINGLVEVSKGIEADEDNCMWWVSPNCLFELKELMEMTPEDFDDEMGGWEADRTVIQDLINALRPLVENRQSAKNPNGVTEVRIIEE